MKITKVHWRFPLTRTHCGMLQANGTFGAMIWGDERLHITVNRADFWDRRGGIAWTEKMTYKNIRQCLEANDEKGLRLLFEGAPPPHGQPRRPSVLPMGRLELDFGKNARPVGGILDVATGEVTVHVRKGGKTCPVRLVLSMKQPLLFVDIPKGLEVEQIIRVPAWRYVGDYLKTISFDPPDEFDGQDLSGWLQMRPEPCVPPTSFRQAIESQRSEDELRWRSSPQRRGRMCFGYRKTDRGLLIAAEYGKTAEAARKRVGALVANAAGKGFARLRKENRAWWKAYWSDVPAIDVPSEDLAFIYYYGMYKFAGLTNPTGVAATLQGAWVEEYQMPPWSSDYHFNINVQECYWPTFMGNRLDHIKPLFKMIRSWTPQLRHNARMFLGIKDGLMLPHSVDDRCVCMGGFWTGSIDHGSTAWVAQLMWLYYRYSMDRAFLRRTAYPFLRGAMRVYEEMLEERDDRLALPVSVSPEYNGSAMNAWGRNASFQLACIHFLCNALMEASRILGVKPDKAWADIAARLPKFCPIGAPGSEQIALWEGMPLERSHRHHSHLAGIYPFDTVDYSQEPGRGVVARSIRHWTHKGMGEWSGWCMPWASIIHSRLGNGDMAELILQIWRRVFTNEGHGTLHDANFTGFSTIAGRVKEKEIMQIEAGMAAVTAVQEMLLQCVRGTIRVFPGVPARWREVSFARMRTEGAFLVSARRVGGRTAEVRIESEAGGPLRIQNNIAPQVALTHRGEKRLVSGDCIEVETRAGDVVLLRPAASPR